MAHAGEGPEGIILLVCERDGDRMRIAAEHEQEVLQALRKFVDTCGRVDRLLELTTPEGGEWHVLASGILGVYKTTHAARREWARMSKERIDEANDNRREAGFVEMLPESDAS